MSNKKLSHILSIIEIAENNLKSAKSLLIQNMSEEKKLSGDGQVSRKSKIVNPEENQALEVIEGYFDGESMVGDNGQIYPVPQNYASKTQLIIGDRMKSILTADSKRIFKLIQPAERERAVGTFAIEGEDYVCLVDNLPQPVKILKASATFAMKNLGLQPGREIAIIIPKKSTPTYGAFSSVISISESQHPNPKASASESLEELKEEVDIEKNILEDYF